jgi:hypothetical protein
MKIRCGQCANCNSYGKEKASYMAAQSEAPDVRTKVGELTKDDLWARWMSRRYDLELKFPCTGKMATNLT